MNKPLILQEKPKKSFREKEHNMKRKLMAAALVAAMIAVGCGSTQSTSSTASVSSAASTAESSVASEAESAASSEAAASESSEENSKVDAAEEGETFSADASDKILSALETVENGTVSYSLETEEVSVTEAGEAVGSDQKSTAASSKIEDALEGDANGVLASIFGSDERVAIDTELATEYPQRAICYIQTTFSDGSVYGYTGTMIDSDTLLTAASNVADPNCGVWPTEILVIPAFDQSAALEDQPYGYAYGTYVCMPEDYYNSIVDLRGDDWYGSSDVTNDIALVTLDSNIGDTVGYLAVSAMSGDLSGMDVALIGYANEGVLAGSLGTIDSSDDSMITFTIDCDESMAGCPVVDYENSVIGIHTAYSSTTNVGVYINNDKFIWMLTNM